MRTPLLFAAASLSLISCKGEPPRPAPPPPPTEGGACNASRAQIMVGKPLLSSSIEDAKRRTGARIGRTLREGQIVTMEYRADRVNLQLDSGMTIVGVRCG